MSRYACERGCAPWPGLRQAWRAWCVLPRARALGWRHPARPAAALAASRRSALPAQSRAARCWHGQPRPRRAYRYASKDGTSTNCPPLPSDPRHARNMAAMMGAMMNAMGGGGMTGPPCELYDGTSLTQKALAAHAWRAWRCRLMRPGRAWSHSRPARARPGRSAQARGNRRATAAHCGGVGAIASRSTVVGARAAHPSTLAPYNFTRPGPAWRALRRTGADTLPHAQVLRTSTLC